MFNKVALIALLSASAYASPAPVPDPQVPAENLPSAEAVKSVAETLNSTGSLGKRDDCNVKACVGALIADIGAIAGCGATLAAAEIDAPVAAIVCGGAIPAAIGTTTLACHGCQVIGACPNDDDDARSNACDWRGGQTALGPNKCLQHKSGVPTLSSTDQKIDGNLVVHCHNQVTVERGQGTNGELCHKPCNQCQQCIGKPSKRDEYPALEAVAFNS